MWGIRESTAPNTSAAHGLIADPADLKAELQAAYLRGRRDQRLRRRSSPMIVASLVAIAAVGAVILFYAAREGSFARGGQVVDAKLSHATGVLVPDAVDTAVSATGAAMQNAGERIKDRGVALDRQASAASKSN